MFLQVLFVSQWQQQALLASKVHGITAALAPRFQTLASLSLAVAGGLQCVLCNPSAEARAAVKQAQAHQAQDDVDLKEILEQLAGVYAEREEVYDLAVRVGLTRDDLSNSHDLAVEQDTSHDWPSRTPVSDLDGTDPKKLMHAYRALVRQGHKLTRQAMSFARVAGSTFRVAPLGAGEDSRGGEEDVWGDVLELLGVERERRLLHDERKSTGALLSGEHLVQVCVPCCVAALVCVPC